MKKTSFVCALILSLVTTPCLAIQYCKDFLEEGNPGGYNSLKTFDDEWTLNPTETVDMDIWVNDTPEDLISAGFWDFPI